MRAQEGDTVTVLAIMLGLDAADFRGWLKPVGPTRMPSATFDSVLGCNEYTVPNTVFVDYGAVNPGDKVVTSAIGMWTLEASGRAAKRRDEGFHVVETNVGGDAEQIRAHLRHPSIYEYEFIGHGNGLGAINGNDDLGYAGVGAERYTLYGIHELALYGCNTAEPWSGKNGGKWLYTPWEMNVARSGQFIGYDNWVRGFPFPSAGKFVVTPGTNTR